MSKLAPFVLAGFAALLAACGSPIVGADCASGYVDCGGRCVDFTDNPQHCGACDHSCGPFTCEDRECTTTLQPDAGLDGSVTDSGQDGGDGDGDGDGDDAGVTPIGTGIPFLPDGGFMFPDIDVGMSCAIGTLNCGGVCVDPQRHHDHCGGCNMPCDADQFCVLGVCDDRCDDPLVLCHEQCIDVSSDPQNCGACDHVCASGICEDSVCADAVAGHVIMIGHDYRSAINDSMARIAGNSLFTASGAPVVALEYRGKALSASIMGVTRALDRRVALARDGRDYELSSVASEDLPLRLIDARALIIHAQDGATDSELNDLGVAWGLALTQFVARGGTIVVFETQTSRNNGTFQVLEPSGLFSAEGRSSAGSAALMVADPGDLVAERAGITYSGTRTTVAFEGVDSPGEIVVQTPAGAPVVVHRFVVP